jgi:hypothetical protein
MKELHGFTSPTWAGGAVSKSLPHLSRMNALGKHEADYPVSRILESHPPQSRAGEPLLKVIGDRGTDEQLTKFAGEDRPCTYPIGDLSQLIFN